MGGAGSHKLQGAARIVQGWWSGQLTWEVMLFTFAVCFGFLSEVGRGSRYRFIKTCRIFFSLPPFLIFLIWSRWCCASLIRWQAAWICSHVEPSYLLPLSFQHLCVVHTCEFTCRMCAWKRDHGSRFWPVRLCGVLGFALWRERWKMAGLSKKCWICCSLDAAVISVPLARK